MPPSCKGAAWNFVLKKKKKLWGKRFLGKKFKCIVFLMAFFFFSPSNQWLHVKLFLCLLNANLARYYKEVGFSVSCTNHGICVVEGGLQNSCKNGVLTPSLHHFG